MIDLSNGRLEEIKAFAEKTNQTEQLNRVLSSLSVRETADTSIELYYDWAPMSLAFLVKYKGNRSYNGGIIYHGSHDGFGSGSAPSFSVSLSNEQGWQIHT